MTRDARLSRRSTVAVLGSGAALASPAFAPDRLQRAPRTQVVVPGGRGPEPPGANGYKPPPRDATPRSAFRFALENAPSMSEAGNGSSIASSRSQVKNAFCRHWPSVFFPRPALSAFTRVHSPSKTGVNALRDALWRGEGAEPRKRRGG